MEDKSKFSEIEYMLLLAIIFSFVGINMYRILPYVCYTEKCGRSIVLFIVCMLISGVVGVALNLKYNRNYLSIIFSACSAVGLYFFISIGKYFTTAVIIMLVLPLILSVAVGILFLTTGIKTRIEWKRRIVIRKRIYRFARVAVFCFSVALILGIVVFPVLTRVKPTEKYQSACNNYFIEAFNNITPPPVYSEESLVVIESYGSEYSFENNIDIIRLIRDNESFLALDYDERCRVIETVLAAEAQELGLFYIEVVFSDVGLGSNTCAVYSHIDREITFNPEFVKKCESAQYMLEVILHELRHCWQHMVTDIYVKATPEEKNLLVFRDSEIAEWAANLNEYIKGNGGEDSFDAYQNQPIEADANKWATKEYLAVYEKIDSLTGGKKSE